MISKTAVMVAGDYPGAVLSDDMCTYVRVWPIAYDVTQADHLIYRRTLERHHHLLQCDGVSVNV
jgi:hypothetical protein